MTGPYYADDLVTLWHGDCLDVLATLPDESVHAVVTDPPYGLANTDPGHVAETIVRWVNGERDYLPGGSGFMGKAWDAFVPPPAVWDECLRVLKPGGHLLAFAGSRTIDLMTLGVRLAGFEIRDSISWLYGSGFPKSLDVSKAIDKAAGVEREVVGDRGWTSPRMAPGMGVSGLRQSGSFAGEYGGERVATPVTAPATPDAERWQGWGTALKPAHEPIVVARKPLGGPASGSTVAANVLTHGTGAINVDATRVRSADDEPWTPAGSPGLAQDCAPCTCAERPACSSDDTARDRGSSTPRRTRSTALVAPADSSHGTHSAPSPSGAEGVPGRRSPLGSPGDCRTSPRSDGERARGASGGARASALQSPGVGSALGPGATSGRSLAGHSNSCPQYTTHDVERPDAPAGRWPTNVVLDESAAAELDRQSGVSAPKAERVGKRGGTAWHGQAGIGSPDGDGRWPADEGGGASRFFPTFRYEPKAPTAERPRIGDGKGSVANQRCAGCGTSRISGQRCTCDEPQWETPAVVAHPTVKPLDLMRWLVRLVTPPGGTVLEPFAGSGTTAEACVIEGFACIAIEREADYLPLIVQRLSKPIEPVLDLGEWTA